jgi:hypothetical protein
LRRAIATELTGKPAARSARTAATTASLTGSRRAQDQTGELPSQPMLSPHASRQRVLVTTTTGEPMQPVRLYYALTAARRPAVVRILDSLRCVGRAPRGPRWGWWHRNEAARLDFSVFAVNARPSPDPVVLATIDLPTAGGMEITVRSYHRAVLAARFFGRRLGDRASLIRLRVLNRLLSAEDLTAGPDAVDDLLDHDVTVVDPRVAAARWGEALARLGPRGVQSMADLEALAGDLAARAAPDVPMVEDFPLCPEEESPDFAALKLTLDLRFLRAMEHSRGRTEVTLRSLILDAVAHQTHAAPG